MQLFRFLSLVDRRQIFYQFVEMPSVTFLGTGPGNVAAGRFQSSILLELGGKRVLLDAGRAVQFTTSWILAARFRISTRYGSPTLMRITSEGCRS